MAQPWRCRLCWKVRSAEALFCNTCGPWQQCIDQTFVPPVPKPPKNQWTYAGAEQWANWDTPTTPRARPKSPRQQTPKPKLGKGKNKGKGKGTGKQQTKTADQPWTPAIPADSSGNTVVQPPQPTLAQDENVIKLLKELRKDETNLSPEVQNLLHASELKSAQQTTKDLHSAVAKFGAAKKRLHTARDARLTLHGAWRQYLQETCSKWQKYLEEFNQQDSALEESIQAATEGLQQAKTHLDEVRAHADERAGAATVEDNHEEEDGDKPQQMAVDSIKEGIAEMAQSLSRLKTKADESFEAQQNALKRFKAGENPPLPSVAHTASMVPFAEAGRGSV